MTDYIVPTDSEHAYFQAASIQQFYIQNVVPKVE